MNIKKERIIPCGFPHGRRRLQLREHREEEYTRWASILDIVSSVFMSELLLHPILRLLHGLIKVKINLDCEMILKLSTCTYTRFRRAKL